MSRAAIRDATAVASALLQIARGVVISPGAATASTSRAASRPWPTQTYRDKTEATAATDAVQGSSAPAASSSTPITPPPARPWPSKAYVSAGTSTQPTTATTSDTSSSAPYEPPRSGESFSALDSEIDSRPLPPEPQVEIDPSPASSPEASILGGSSPAVSAEPETPLPTPEPPNSFKRTISETPAGFPDAVTDPPSNFGDLDPVLEDYDAVKESKIVPLRAAKVPSSRLGRLFHYGGLGAGLAFGAADSLLRGNSTGGQSSNLFMSEQNVARLVDKLSTMRGAALKLGQFLSIQETKLLPPQLEQVLLRVQNSANYMPIWQMNKVMSQELGGADWKERHFSQFDDVPFASASIGQVHSAVLRDDFSDPEMAGKRVAVKVQFPGVQDSIDSDLSYLRWLVSASALLPKGLFLENTLRVLGQELKDECDYLREAEMGRKFRHVLRDSNEFQVPKVVDTLSTGSVLTTEMMMGRPLSMASRYSQKTRDRIAQSILNLALSELFRYRLMQTDPNWSNFLYSERDGKIQLIDFGATRQYDKAFMDDWLRMLQAAVRGDRNECIEWSRKVGYLTGQESGEMEQAHVESMIALGEPFREGAPDPFPFESQTITDRVKAQIPLMLRERLTPPPQETYSLNRKLSGAFLLCARLKAHVRCRTMFKQIEDEYVFGPDPALSSDGGGEKGPFSSTEQRRYLHHAVALRRDRKRGRNLDDRFPRSMIFLRGNEEDPHTVESLGPAPTAAPSIAEETPANANVSEGATVNLLRKEIPAETSSPTAESPMSARDENTDVPITATPTMGPTVIRGVVIPLKPPPPGPEECCMSGCAHCTYDIYAEDLEDFHTRLSAVRAQLTELSPPVSMEEWRQDLLGDYPSASSGDKSDNSAAERAQREVDRVIGDLDPTMKAFLEMERKMKAKERVKHQDNHAVA